MTSVYKSAEGERAVRERYIELLKHWPVPSQQLRVPTREGETFLVASGEALSGVRGRHDWRRGFERAVAPAVVVGSPCALAGRCAASVGARQRLAGGRVTGRMAGVGLCDEKAGPGGKRGRAVPRRSWAAENQYCLQNAWTTYVGCLGQAQGCGIGAGTRTGQSIPCPAVLPGVLRADSQEFPPAHGEAPHLQRRCSPAPDDADARGRRRQRRAHRFYGDQAAAGAERTASRDSIPSRSWPFHSRPDGSDSDFLCRVPASDLAQSNK